MTQRQSASLLVDKFLVASAQSGDRAAWNQLAQRWEAKLVSHAYRLLGDKEAARDAAQSGWGSCSLLPRLNYKNVAARPS